MTERGIEFQSGRGVVAARLEQPTSSGHTVRQLIASWLANLSDSTHTREAYQDALVQWLRWCDERNLDPLAIRRPEFDMYAGWLKETPTARTGKPLKPRSRGQRLAAVDNWYRYLADVGVLDAVPTSGTRRPTVPKGSETATVTEQQARHMLAVSRYLTYRALDARCAILVLHLMVMTGGRVSEICSVNHDDLGHRGDFRVLTLHQKGGEVRVRPIPVQLGPMLDDYRVHIPDPADTDATRALFRDRRGYRITRHQMYRLVPRVAAAAGIPDAHHVTPHSLRHAFNDIAKARGASLEDRRDALGHASADTTRLYDHVPLSIHNDPAHIVGSVTWTDTLTHDSQEGQHSC